MMKNYDESVNTNHDPNWPDHPSRILIIKCVIKLNNKSMTRY